MGLLQVEHIDTGPRDQGGGLLLGLRHRVAPQRLLGEGDPLVESSTLENLAMFERDRANLYAALEYITASVELTDTLRSRVVSPDLRATFVASVATALSVRAARV